MKVVWTTESYEALKNLKEYIAKDSEYYARRTIERIINRSKQIKHFPAAGRQVPEYNNPYIREIFEGDYRIIYKIKRYAIDVLTVIHASRKLQ